MKAVIRLDVPEWQIGQDVMVYFPDTMVQHAVCEQEKHIEALKQPQIVRCKDCKHGVNETYDLKENKIISIDCRFAETHDPDWFCADGERRTDDGRH